MVTSKKSKTIGEYLFWQSLIFILFAFLLILYFNEYGFYYDLKSPGTIYTNSLTIILSVISIIFAVVIFLLQNTNSNYSYKFSLAVLQSKYYFWTLISILVFSIYNLLCFYFNLIYPYDFLSVTSSIGLIGLIFSILFLTIFYSDVNNTIRFYANKINPKFDKKGGGFSALFSNKIKAKQFIKDFNPLITTCIKSVELNQPEVLETTLDEMEYLTQEYLESTENVFMGEDAFLSELNDQFEFIISQATKSYNQKLIEPIAEKIGDISINIVKKRSHFHVTDINVYMWFTTNKNLFLRCYGLNRTKTNYIIIDRLESAIFYLMKTRPPQHFITIRQFLDDIANFCFNQKEHWGNRLGQRIIASYVKIFVKMIDTSVKNILYMGDFYFDEFSQKFSSIFNNFVEQSNRIDRTSFINTLYGMNGLPKQISDLKIILTNKDPQKKILFQCFENLIQFHKYILFSGKTNFDSTIFQANSDILYILNKKNNFQIEDKIKLSADLTTIWEEQSRAFLTSTIKNERNHTIAFLDYFIEYYALFLFFYHEKTKLMETIFDKPLKVYLEHKKRSNEHNSKEQYLQRNLYKSLKLIGCWIDQYPNLATISEKYKSLLTKDFQEHKSRSSFEPPLLEKYGYYSGFYLRRERLWTLPGSSVFDFTFSEEIEKELNKNNGEHYITYHKILKKSHSKENHD